MKTSSSPVVKVSSESQMKELLAFLRKTPPGYVEPEIPPWEDLTEVQPSGHQDIQTLVVCRAGYNIEGLNEDFGHGFIDMAAIDKEIKAQLETGSPSKAFVRLGDSRIPIAAIQAVVRVVGRKHDH